MGVYSDVPRVYLRHEDIGGEAVVSDEPGVVEMYEGKGWVRGDTVPAHLDPDASGVVSDAPEEPAPEKPAEKKRARKSEPEAESATTTAEEGKVNG